MSLPARSERPASRTRGAALLTAANLVVVGCGLVTGVILARSLGAQGRGTLAAILVPFYLAPLMIDLGLSPFATRAVARGTRVGDLAGTLGGLLAAAGGLALIGMVFLAPVLADGREQVERYLVIGFAVIPLIVVGTLLQAIARGLERWRLLAAARVAPGLTGVIGLGALALAGEVTVERAAVVNFVGAAVPSLLFAGLVVSHWPPRASAGIVREGLGFGSRAWVGSLATVANNRADQLIMIPLTSARQLGLYVVAVTIASLSATVVAAFHAVLGPRVARGDHEAVGTTLRLTALTVVVLHLALAAVTPVMLPLLFGDQFEPAVAMTWVLLLAGLPGACAYILTGALTNAGHPALPSGAEVAAVIVTAVGLALFLPEHGGIAAAWVSVVAYSTSVAIQLGPARRVFGLSLREMVIPHRGDVRRVLDTLPLSRALRRS